jgi:ribonuclease P protein component
MKNEEISAVITQGRAYKSSSFLFKTLDLSHISKEDRLNKEPSNSKISFLAPKKTFKLATERNKARRRAKAALIKALSKSFKKLNNGDKYLLFSLNKAILKVKMEELTTEMTQILQESGII